MMHDIHKRAKVYGPPGCLSKDTTLSFKRSERNSGRLYTIKDAFYKFHGIPRKKSGKWQRRSGRNYLWDRNLSTSTLSLKGKNHIGYHQVENILYSGIKITYLVKTKNSFLRITKEHPFLLPTGEFIPLEELSIGSEVVCRQSEVKKRGKNPDGRKKRKIVYSVQFHPYGWDHVINGFNYKRISYATAVLEATMNDLPVNKFINIIRSDQEKTLELEFLPSNIARHHKDFNPLNDEHSNLEIMTKKEHDKLHGMKAGYLNFGNQNTFIDKIISIERYGKEETYDIIMKEPHHNYCAHGFVVHNTGKTTYLLNLIEQAAKKYDPERIGAVSLTNAAIEEMRDRVKKQTGLPREAAKNIRTIHSTCFNLLDLKKENVADKKIKEFNEACPEWRMPLNVEITENDEFKEDTDKYTPEQNKRRFAEIQMLRHQMVPFKEWPDLRLKSMYTDWQNWMYENDYIDFTGMLEKTLESELCPEIDILMVDEAQDMSRLSVSLLEMWGKDTVSTVYVGDSDQAILRFAGAVPEAFVNLNHTWMKVLGKSYRVPKKVHEYAMEIIGQIKNREDVTYEPTEVEGSVIRCTEPDLSLDGTHMILGRCNYHLNRWRHYLLRNRVMWHNPYRPRDMVYNPLNTKVWRAARNYVRLGRGEVISNIDFRHMTRNTIAEGNIIRGMKTQIEDMELDKEIDMFGVISSGIFTKEFLTFEKTLEEVFKLVGQSGEMLRSCDDIMEEPKITLGTFHSVKGGESDHIWLDMSTSPECLRSCIGDAERFYDEVRVAYVGITRAKESVGLLNSYGAKGQVWGM